MPVPHSTDRPDAPAKVTPPEAVDAPPLVPDHSPWWHAPSGKPIGIPDFVHELRAFLEWLFGVPRPEPVLVPVKVRRPR